MFIPTNNIHPPSGTADYLTKLDAKYYNNAAAVKKQTDTKQQLREK